MTLYNNSSAQGLGEPLLDGDGAFFGVDMMRTLDELPAGVMASARNVRFERGAADTRPAVQTVHWGSEADVDWSTNPPTHLDTTGVAGDYYFTYLYKGGPVYGGGRFNDPDGRDLIISVREDHLLGCEQFNRPRKITFPAGATVTGPCQVLAVGARLMIRAMRGMVSR